MSKDQTLPSVDAVLNKLKSDGTFDQVRRTCLGHIQGEPSFRAYSEHMEVVSRRYLQNYKWKESSTKNEVRGRLKDHVLGVIVSPDIQVGTPLIDIVEKVLESKAKELIPKISDAVNFLCETKTSQIKEAASKKVAVPPHSSSSQSSASTTETAKSDFVDLSLPIDIPGLRPQTATAAGTSTSGSVKKDSSSGNDAKQNKPRPKGTTDTKDIAKSGNKNKNVVTTKSVTPSIVKDNGKVKGEPTLNKDKERSVIDKDSASVEKSGKEKEKPKMGRIPKKQKLDKKEKETVEKQDTGAAKNTEQPEPYKAVTELSATNSSNERTKPSEEPVSQTTAKRRSARLASQSESRAGSESDDQGSDNETEHGSSDRKRRRSSTNTMSKKAKVLITSSSSGSECDDAEVSSGGYESDTDQQSEEEGGSKKDPPIKTKRKRKLYEDKASGLHSVKKSKLTSAASPVPSTYKPNKKNSNPSQKSSLRVSMSPPVVVTRYNRSVKPNRRYYEGSAEVSPNEEELDDHHKPLETVNIRTKLDTTRPCDVGADLEIDSSALVTGKEEVIYTMIKPKPAQVKIRKTQVKAVRSRQKTKTRISFFCHR